MWQRKRSLPRLWYLRQMAFLFMQTLEKVCVNALKKLMKTDKKKLCFRKRAFNEYKYNVFLFAWFYVIKSVGNDLANYSHSCDLFPLILDIGRTKQRVIIFCYRYYLRLIIIDAVLCICDIGYIEFFRTYVRFFKALQENTSLQAISGDNIARMHGREPTKFAWSLGATWAAGR